MTRQEKYRRRNLADFARRQNEYRERNLEKCRDSVRRSQYSLEHGQYEEMLLEQNDVCAICKGPPRRYANLGIDHDHNCCQDHTSCGECVRGLLCELCNMMLGYARDNAGILSAAAKYLKKFK